MKKRFFLLITIFLCNSGFTQYVPDVLHYRFDGISSTNKIPNQATNPPSGTDSATFNGSVTVGDTGFCGTALIGTGNTSSTDYVDTRWNSKIVGSWTVAFWIKKIPTSSTLFYIFGDVNATGFRCFTNGVAGPGNWMLRGPFSDLKITGGANMDGNFIVFTYNDTTMVLSGYLNGILNNSVTLTTAPNITSTTTLKVCGYSGSVGLPTGGLMDNFMFFSKCIPASAVTKIFDCNTVKLSGCDQVVSPSKKYVYTKSGTYKDTLIGSLGQDSSLNLEVTVNKSYLDSMNLTVCSELLAPSKKYTYTKSGIYLDTLITVNGCDSVIKINLIVNYPTTVQINKTVCGGYMSPTGKYYSASGNYSDTLLNYLGCDSLILTNLIVNQSTFNTDTVLACEFYNSPMGKLYTVSGLYYDTIMNSNGCDSFITTNLTILKPSSFQQTLVECDSYISPSGKVYTQTGNYSDTIPNSIGCDSIISTNLTINRSYLNTNATVVRSCNKYQTPKGTWIYQTGMYYDTFTTANGCDSILTLDVTIDKVNKSVTTDAKKMVANQAGAGYRWLDCNNNFAVIANEISDTFEPVLDGIYAVEITLNSCKEISECYEMKNLSSNIISVSNVSIYPNPGTGKFEIFNKNAKIQTVKILNSNGQELMVKSNIQSQSTSVNLTEWSAGIYIFEIVADGYSGKYKVVKMN